MQLRKVQGGEEQVVALINDHIESESQLINCNLISVCKSDIFLHFLNDLGKSDLNNFSSELVIDQVVFALFVLVKRESNHVAHDSQVLSANVACLIPVTGLTKLSNQSKSFWFLDVFDRL